MLHVTFTPSGAGILRRALRQQLGEAAKGSEVIALFDPLCIGPIDPPEPTRRLAWMIERLGVLPEDWDWLPDSTGAFWTEALAAETPLVWVSRRSANEYCGFLEWNARFWDAAYTFVDVTDATIVSRTGKRHPLISISQVGPEFLEIEALMASGHSATAAERSEMQRRWELLQRDGANLRIVRDGEIVSVSEDYFDPLVLAAVSNAWREAALVAGMAMANSDPTTIPIHHLHFEGRIIELVRRGVLEGRGDPHDLRKYEVRLAGQIRN